MNHPLLASVRHFGPRYCMAVVSLALVWVAVAVSVAWSAHVSRQLFAELHAQQREYDQLLERRAQLLVERSTVADLAHIERVAGADLDMVLPDILAFDPTVAQ